MAQTVQRTKCPQEEKYSNFHAKTGHFYDLESFCPCSVPVFFPMFEVKGVSESAYTGLSDHVKDYDLEGQNQGQSVSKRMKFSLSRPKTGTLAVFFTMFSISDSKGHKITIKGLEEY